MSARQCLRLASILLGLSLTFGIPAHWPVVNEQGSSLFELVGSATALDIPLEVDPTEVGVRNPAVDPGISNDNITGFGRRKTINTWVPFVFDIPDHLGLVVKAATLEVTIEGIDADGDGNWDDLPTTDAIGATGKGGWPTQVWLFGDFTTLYKSGETPLSPKTIKIDLMWFPGIVKVLNEETRLNVVEEDDSSCLGAKLFLTLGPPRPSRAAVKKATKVCNPSDAYPPIPAQPGAGNFPAIPQQPPTEITCTLDLEVEIKPDPKTGDKGPVNVVIADAFSPGLFFGNLVTSNPATAVTSYINDVVTFNPIKLALPDQVVLQNFPIKLTYTANLNDIANQRQFQQNSAQLTVLDAAAGTILMRAPIPGVKIDVLNPRLEVEKLVSSSTGLPGDKKTFTVIVQNLGDIYLESVNVDALIPNNTTLIPESVDPPTAVVGDTIQWRNLGPINAFSSLALTYAVTIDANTAEGTQLIDRAFATAQAPNFFGSGNRQLNASSNLVTVMVSPILVGIDLTLVAQPTQSCFPGIIAYIAKVRNTGEFWLDEVELQLAQGTLPLAGNPAFPLKLDPLAPGESRELTFGCRYRDKNGSEQNCFYKGQIGLTTPAGFLIDVAIIAATPKHQNVQVAPPVRDAAIAAVEVLSPVITKITPEMGAQGSSNLELKIEGACFAPGAVVSFQPSTGIEVIPPSPPNFGFEGPTELRQRINIASDAPIGERQVFVTNPNKNTSNPGSLTVVSSSCTFSISPTSQSFGSGDGTGSISVTAQSGCNWTAVSNASWITITSDSSGSGNGTVSYSVATNTSTDSRTGTLTIAGQTMTVSQEAQSSGPNLTPYKPSGWSDKIVVSNSPGATTDANHLKTGDILYVNWAVVNEGSTDILNRFYISLYVDGAFEASWYVDSLDAGYYVYVNDYPLGKLGAGIHTIAIVADSNEEIIESVESDNKYIKTITIKVENPDEKMPNLAPYQLEDWSDALVITTSKGSRVDSSSITTEDKLYINWAVLNDGPVATPKGFSVDLYIDGVLENTWSYSSPLKSNYYRPVKDYLIGKLESGDHFIELMIDSNEEISESDEEDNYYFKMITVEGPFPFLLFPSLRPYQPEGWSDKIVVSTRRRTFTDSPSFTTHDTVYVDWAVINDGEVGISKGFSVSLYVDGVVKKNWKLLGLKANDHYAVKDYSIGKLSVGFHTLTLVADPGGVIMEWDRGDNEYNKTIQVLGSP